MCVCYWLLYSECFVSSCVNNQLHVCMILIAKVVDCPLREREVAGSNLVCTIPKAIKMVSVTTLLGAQY